MVTGFWVHRSRPMRSVPDHRYRSKETVVARREHQQSLTREIRVTFEPHRLSPAWVAQAYEQVVPIARRSTTQPLVSLPKDSEPSSRADTPNESSREGDDNSEVCHDIENKSSIRRSKSGQPNRRLARRP
jgi:hypothetical protein